MADRRVLVDTDPLVALLSADDAHHEACVRALALLPPPLVTCWPVLTEAAWLLRKRPGAVEKLLEAFDAGLLALPPLGPEAAPWLGRFLRRYEDAGAQLADAALMYLAEQHGIATVFTLDRRDFSVYRLRRNRSLRIIPEAP